MQNLVAYVFRTLVALLCLAQRSALCVFKCTSIIQSRFSTSSRCNVLRTLPSDIGTGKKVKTRAGSGENIRPTFRLSACSACNGESHPTRRRDLLDITVVSFFLFSAFSSLLRITTLSALPAAHAVYAYDQRPAWLSFSIVKMWRLSEPMSSDRTQDLQIRQTQRYSYT